MTLPALDGCRILVVEDDFFLALDLEQSLQAAGATVVGPVPTVAGALALIEAELVGAGSAGAGLVGTGPTLDAAVLDVNLGGEMVYPITDRLLLLGVPLVFATGYGEADLPARLAHVPRLEKPVDAASMAQAIKQAIERSVQAGGA